MLSTDQSESEVEGPMAKAATGKMLREGTSTEKLDLFHNVNHRKMPDGRMKPLDERSGAKVLKSWHPDALHALPQAGEQKHNIYCVGRISSIEYPFDNP